MQTVWEYIRKERAALKRAPLSFAGLAVVCLAAGIGVGRWHYSERLETKDGQIQRYRVALRIDKAGGNALMELTNSELKAKSLNTASNVRDLCQAFEKRMQDIKQPSKGNDAEAKAFEEKRQALMREVSDEYDRNLRADFLNANNELLRRLDSKAVASVIRNRPVFSDADTGTPVGLPSLLPSGTGMEAFWLCQFADEVEQLAKLLP